MQKLADLDLPHLPLEDPALASNPYPYFAAARAKHPWLATSNIGYIVHEFRAIRELYDLDDKLRPSFESYIDYLGARETPWGRYTLEMIRSMPDDRHKVMRAVFDSKFTPRIANQLRTLMRASMVQLLDEWAPKGEFNFEEFVSYYPVSVMFNVIGAPPQEIAGIRQSLEMLGLALGLGKDAMPQVQEAFLHLERVVVRLIGERRAEPTSADDLLNLLIATEDSGAIGHRQLVDMLIFLFVAGYDTSKNVLTFTMYTLLQYPEIYERCANDLDYCAKVVEESLRYFNPAISPRHTTANVVFRDVLIPKDTIILFALNVSGRDPGTFENPDKFDPERPIEAGKRQVAFGLGKHMCIGQHIARVQIQEGLHQIAKRIRNPRLTGKVGWRPFASTWGLQGLPLAFTPGPKQP
jgi:cytochrome P450